MRMFHNHINLMVYLCFRFPVHSSRSSPVSWSQPMCRFSFSFLYVLILWSTASNEHILQVLITMVTGMCFGWGLGAAAMRAALAARDQTVLKQSLLREQQRYVYLIQ